MHCQKCGTEIRASARFCRNCGAAVEQRPEPKRSVPRLTAIISRNQANQEEAIILPIKDLREAPEEARKESEAAASAQLPPPTQVDLPSLAVTNRVTTQMREDSPPEPPAVTAELLSTESLLRESEAKPFFTRMLSPGANRQHNRLVAVVPLMLLIVIILFIFAYIAAR